MSDALEALNAEIEAHDAEVLTEEFAVQCMGDLRVLLARKAMVERTHQLAVEDLERRHRAQLGRMAHDQFQLERSLEAFARRAIPTVPKGRSYPLGYGVVKLTKPSASGSVEVTDKVLFSRWAESATLPTTVPGVRVKFEADAAVLKSEAFQRTPITGEPNTFQLVLEGETVPGVRVVVETEDRFSYELAVDAEEVAGDE